jgi:hypothetical protein
MKAIADSGEMPLPRAAVRLRLTWAQAFNALLAGRLDGRQAENGRWWVSSSSVERLAAQRDEQPGAGVRRATRKTA